MFVSCVLVYLLTVSYVYCQNSFSNHKNINLLPKRGKCGIQPIQEKVFGGTAAGLDEYPWMALLEYQKNGKNTGFQCGGSLISEKYVVTAAHCFVGTVVTLYGEAFSARFGEHNLDTNPDCVDYPDDERVCVDPYIDVQLEQRIPHSLYDDYGPNKHHDIGLARLKSSITFSAFRKPICLPLNNEQARPGNLLSVSGWGQTERGKRSRIKLKADLPLISNQKCAQIYANDAFIIDNQLCAGGEDGIDSCNGDSGGPLVKNFPNKTDYYLEGVVSFGLTECGTKNVPGVYTKVNRYIKWILDNMKP